MTCLENARDILKVLEREYQATFEKKLTLKRLGEVISYPRRPDIGEGVNYDERLLLFSSGITILKDGGGLGMKG